MGKIVSNFGKISNGAGAAVNDFERGGGADNFWVVKAYVKEKSVYVCATIKYTPNKKVGAEAAPFNPTPCFAGPAM